MIVIFNEFVRGARKLFITFFPNALKLSGKTIFVKNCLVTEKVRYEEVKSLAPTLHFPKFPFPSLFANLPSIFPPGGGGGAEFYTPWRAVLDLDRLVNYLPLIELAIHLAINKFRQLCHIGQINISFHFTFRTEYFPMF